VFFVMLPAVYMPIPAFLQVSALGSKLS